MKRNHVVTLIAFLSGLSSMGAAFHTWGEILDVRFFFGVLGLGAAVLNASYTDSPEPTNAVSRATASVVQTLSGTGDSK